MKPPELKPANTANTIVQKPLILEALNLVKKSTHKPTGSTKTSDILTQLNVK